MIADLANDVWAAVALSSPVIGGLLLCYLVAAAAVAVFGARVKRRKRLIGAGRFVATIVIATAAIGLLAHYVWLAGLRRTAHDCDSQVSDNHEYIGKQCFLNAGLSYLRVYDAQTKSLLADRTYTCNAADTKLFVGDQMAFDACAEGDSSIRLPPSLLDRLRALLP